MTAYAHAHAHAHAHDGPPSPLLPIPLLPIPLPALAALLVCAVVLAYLLAAGRLRRRGDAWPPVRDLSFVAGGATLVYAALGPLPGGPFTAHMAVHLAAGMVAPPLLVLGRPLSLLPRVLPPGRLRRLPLAFARSRPGFVLLLPPVAALLDVGALWLLYRTPLWSAAQAHPLTHAALHLHVFAAGLLFAFTVCQVDPVHRRHGLALRGGTLLLAGAAHSVLAKSLYAHPPPGAAVAGEDLRTGALLMYHGGDAVEVALAVVLAVGWYTAGGRATARARRRARPRPAPDTGSAATGGTTGSAGPFRSRSLSRTVGGGTPAPAPPPGDGGG
ncbi:cytochrome c oxidase assembly protein [Streptomyces sp. ST2-7A]|uniref:cytochrome c oxidase assembly protein n=1 Tax=Streptomyces sp. ST2-7A TaxID=2907214 RepID=UPI001F4677F1|nr:cytochrome c oxidase assembly protein [Streptomyces sp. ST2-7A]MCE7078662.1 cytochrome c oxidase assembly protein [Streptomyces sp. ST2-7A]